MVWALPLADECASAPLGHWQDELGHRAWVTCFLTLPRAALVRGDSEAWEVLVGCGRGWVGWVTRTGFSGRPRMKGRRYCGHLHGRGFREHRRACQTPMDGLHCRQDHIRTSFSLPSTEGGGASR
ncbi:hypothetical protein E2C01_057457 [Portunus trituberculatus]|uniref:Uncharacterized protein n=1 Tax=Portunus trituberculatus TaxID=210409 RepID=A0A5B7H0D9_PORTR|nr:hypothetical protein [Portunus trituberculatus]